MTPLAAYAAKVTSIVERATPDTPVTPPSRPTDLGDEEE